MLSSSRFHPPCEPKSSANIHDTTQLQPVLTFHYKVRDSSESEPAHPPSLTLGEVVISACSNSPSAHHRWLFPSGYAPSRELLGKYSPDNSQVMAISSAAIEPNTDNIVLKFRVAGEKLSSCRCFG